MRRHLGLGRVQQAPRSPTPTATGSCSTTATRRIPTARLHEQGRAPRALPRAADADDDRRVVAVHRPQGLRPGRLRPERPCPGDQAPRTMLEIDVAGLATVDGGGIEIERAPEGIRFELLDEAHPQLGRARRRGREVRGPERRAAGSTACSSTSRRASSSSSRSTCASPTRPTESALFWRLLVIAEPGSRFSLIEELVLSGPGARGLLERGRRALRRPGGQGRVRLAPEPRARDVALRLAPRAGRARRRARLGRRRLRLEEGQGPDRERPRRPGRDLARHGRVLRGRRPAPRLRHAPGAPARRTRPRTSRSRARCATRRPRSGAG